MLKILQAKKTAAAELAAKRAECLKIQEQHDQYLETLYTKGTFPHLPKH